MIIVIGRISTRSWDGQDGKKCYATEVVASEVSFGESKNNSSAAGDSSSEEFVPLLENDEDLPWGQ